MSRSSTTSPRVPLRDLSPPGGSTQVRPQAIAASRIESNLDDEKLVERILDGDIWAKEAMYRRYVAQAYRVARRLVRQTADAEDVVQEAFAQAFADLPKLRDKDALRPWLLRIVVHRSHRRFRWRRLTTFFVRGDEEARDVADVGPYCPPDVAAELALVEVALAAEPPALRAAWVLRRVEGCSLAEVAAACECSLATVKRRVAQVDERVLAHLREGEAHAD